MKLITIDFETYYDRQFSLTKVTTEEYVRSPLFETIGVATQINNEKPVWVPKHDVADHLASIDWSDAMVVAQNTAFDGAIMSWRYGIKPIAWADTLGMSRALFPHEKSHSLAKQAERMRLGRKGDEVLNALGKHYDDFTPEEMERYAAYCCHDVELTYGLFNIYMDMGFPKKEMQLIDLTLRMFTEPALVLDKEHLTDHYEDVLTRKELLLDTVRKMLHANDEEDVKKLLMSNQKFAILLESFGVEPPMKTSLTTGKQAYAFAKTDEEFQALSDHEDDRVQAIVAARLGNKSTIEETRTKRFIDMADRGSFPVPLRYYGAHSGRWSGQDKVNLQNLPSRGPNAKKIKQSIKAPEGYVVIDCDSAQIEARTLAWLAGQSNLVEAFAQKEDVYKIMAEAIYDTPREKIDTQQRQVGKTVILGAGYGVGHHKLQLFLKTQAGVEVELHEAKRMIDTYRASNFRIKELWYKADEALDALRLGQTFQVDAPGVINVVPWSGLTLPSGLFIQYPNLYKSYDADKGRDQWTYKSKGIKTYIYGGKVVENFTQAVARCVVGEQMLRIAKRYKVALTVHDSVVALAKRDEQEEAVAYIEACMSWQPSWAKGLPLACESDVGDSYGG
jgi:DNA polymerase I-like protein with 3'-5' exonuclease and polymerase domains